MENNLEEQKKLLANLNTEKENNVLEMLLLKTKLENAYDEVRLLSEEKQKLQKQSPLVDCEAITDQQLLDRNNKLKQYLKDLFSKLYSSIDSCGRLNTNTRDFSTMSLKDLQGKLDAYLEYIESGNRRNDMAEKINCENARWYQRLSILTTLIAFVTTFTSIYLYKNPSIHHI